MASVVDAAQRLGVDVRTIRRLIASGELPANREEPDNPRSPWDVSEEALAAREAALLDDVASVPAVGHAMEHSVNDMMESTSRFLKSALEVIELYQRPVKLYLDKLSDMLEASQRREAQLQEQLFRGYETIQLAMDRTSERQTSEAEAMSSIRRKDGIVDFVREQLPIALRYGTLAKHLPHLAPLIAGSFTPEALESMREEMSPEQWEALQAVIAYAREEAAKPPPTQAPPQQQGETPEESAP